VKIKINKLPIFLKKHYPKMKKKKKKKKKITQKKKKKKKEIKVNKG